MINSMEQSTPREDDSSLASQEISLILWTRESSLMCSQVLTTETNPESVQSSLLPYTQSFKIYYPPFPSDSPIKILYAFLICPWELHFLVISFSLFLSP